MDFISLNFLHPAIWIKIITLIAIVFYVIFTFIVFTQVRVMSEIFSISDSKTILRIISIAHVVLAVSLFIIAIVIL